MNKTLNYLFDPLCGWCYGTSASLPAIIRSTGVDLQLIPTGLFSGDGSREIDEQFANYAWDNDQRIFHITGQPFSEHYRSQILKARNQRLDSGPVTVALTAVNQTDPSREYEMLMAFQAARYIDGMDITNPDVLCKILTDNGQSEARRLFEVGHNSVHKITTDRIEKGQAMLNAYGARGVPTFILEDTSGSRLLHSSLIFSSPEDFSRELITKRG